MLILQTVKSDKQYMHYVLYRPSAFKFKLPFSSSGLHFIMKDQVANLNKLDVKSIGCVFFVWFFFKHISLKLHPKQNFVLTRQIFSLFRLSQNPCKQNKTASSLMIPHQTFINENICTCTLSYTHSWPVRKPSYWCIHYQ